ncbi:hypothetical protein PoB_007609100 [Plakobranchus ocellatus]|uniref:Uncharacterized protein n=1 Tax=Plakobranchus ocellatus TaxID=259542 RepID=A0AAV4E0F9_9GAST|nr:hypothetical protein PoB_007609100 [Plakobranchus ocellatus]
MSLIAAAFSWYGLCVGRNMLIRLRESIPGNRVITSSDVALQKGNARTPEKRCFLYIASPQQGDLRLSGPLTGRDAGSRAQTCDRRVPADLRADPSVVGSSSATGHAPVISSIISTPGPQQGDLRLSGPPSGQDAGGGAQTRDRMVPADLRADSLATVPPTPPSV